MNSYNMSKKIEKIKQNFRKSHGINVFYILIALLLSLGIFRGLNSRWLTQGGDAAGFVDSLAGDQPAFRLNFTYGLSFTRLRELWSDPSNLPPISPFSNIYEGVSFFEIHPYIFSYFFRWIPQPFFEIQWAPLFLLATSYSIGILLLLKYLEIGLGSNYKVALVFATIATSPILVESMRGQPYFDKLFFGPCIALIFILYYKDLTKTQPRILALLLLIMLQSLSERTTLMSSIVALLILITKYKSNFILNRKILQVTILSVFGIFWHFFWIRNFSANTDLNNLGFTYYIHNLKEAFFGDRRNNLLIFFLLLLPFILLMLGKIRFIFFTFVFILPNLIVTVGGAELTGFLTHYHSLHLPIVLSFSVIAISHCYSSENVAAMYKYLIPVSLCLSFVANGSYNYFTLGIENNKTSLANTQARVLDVYGLAPGTVEQGRRSQEQGLLKSLRDFRDLKVNHNTRISSPEVFMPTLTSLGFRTIDYFPIGIGDNEIIIVPYLDETEQEIDVVFYGQLPREYRNLWSERILNELNESYVRVSFLKESFGNFAIYFKS